MLIPYFSEIFQKPEPEFAKIPCQGDIFRKEMLKLDVINPESISGWMIINTTCDFAAKKLDFFCFVPIRPLVYYLEKNIDLKKGELKQNLDTIIRNNTFKTFFLPATPLFDEQNDHYCELQYIFSVGVGINFEKTCEKMLSFRITSLKSPWREKLGHLLDNNFSRVGIPEPKAGYKNARDKMISQVI